MAYPSQMLKKEMSLRNTSSLHPIMDILSPLYTSLRRDMIP
jgi:hypothetical protein